ncbi:hypothetical protein HL658_31025 [Azospirillum sp. RWY-5-1]|uniref:Uncharacterized protein n=1 Tax=Azospirillum oleiclasticum TaxID=2735135 RepID=A0ABX2TMG1_9PROT|nr:hypothetical protein [Azospirillum oleiclasticum]NYZ16997.1 hypothetical protein [Azospirillum oleiclasticum]NYZ24559.1 hypothetical protein [Azospirillum oleiclasticum]
MKETPFRVGDRVTVHTSQGGPQGLTVVEKFTQDGRCMVLADGSLWRADGKRQWSFRGSFYKGPFVEKEAPGDADHIAKRRIVGRIRKFADTLTIETPLSATALRRILDVIEAEETAAGATG